MVLASIGQDSVVCLTFIDLHFLCHLYWQEAIAEGLQQSTAAKAVVVMVLSTLRAGQDQLS